MAEDQVVVGDKVEEPYIQLLCIVALENQFKQRYCIKRNEKDSLEN